MVPVRTALSGPVKCRILRLINEVLKAKELSYTRCTEDYISKDHVTRPYPMPWHIGF